VRLESLYFLFFCILQNQPTTTGTCLNPKVREDENHEIRGMYHEIYQLLISTYKKVGFIYIKEIAYNNYHYYYYYYDHCYYLLCVSGFMYINICHINICTMTNKFFCIYLQNYQLLKELIFQRHWYARQIVETRRTMSELFC